MTVKVGVIGTGFGARVVAPIFAAVDGCEVVGVVSARDEAGATALARRADVDLICVHSPPFLHGRDVGVALEAGKAVMCDKPFGLDAQDAADMLDAATRGHAVHLVNFEFRWQPARAVMRDAIARGDIGRVEHVHWFHLVNATRVPLRQYGWLFDAARGGGWIGAWGSHAVDSLRFFFGEVERVVAAERRVDVVERVDSNGIKHPCTAEDGLSATLVLDGGATVTLDSSFAAAASLPTRLTVYGDAGAIEVVGDERVTLFRADGTRDELRAPVRPAPGTDPHAAAMTPWAEAVRDSVRDGAPRPGAATFADGHACDLVLEQLRAAPVV
jgi:predicted dehydrogenase